MSKIRSRMINHETSGAVSTFAGNFFEFLEEFITLPVSNILLFFSVQGQVFMGKCGIRKGNRGNK